MKFNPYPVLLTLGGLMLATVIVAQSGGSFTLLRAGMASVDRDVSRDISSLAAKMGAEPARPTGTRAAAETRLASVHREDGTVVE
jgi:hypothetical protein